MVVRPPGDQLTATDIASEPLGALADELRHGGAEVETVVGDVSVDEASFITGAVLPVDGGFLAR